MNRFCKKDYIGIMKHTKIAYLVLLDLFMNNTVMYNTTNVSYAMIEGY